MKYLLNTLLIVMISIAYTYAQDSKVEGPVMSFDETVIEYGTIEQGSDPLRVFTFTNTGTEPLIIKRAKGSCGCTVPSYKKEPIMPGEQGKIEVRYDTKRLGKFAKTVRIYTNEKEEPHVLTIKGKTYKKEKEQSVPKVKENIFNSGKN